MPEFSLPAELTSRSGIEYWAGRCVRLMSEAERQSETRLENMIGPEARAAGYLTKSAFLDLCRWKSPRPQRLQEGNASDYVEAVTRTSLSTPHERLRIEVLTLLRGVDWRTASAILHIAHKDPYPILDFRAVGSLGQEAPSQCNFQFWWDYVQFCRQTAGKYGVSMRTLDRALWRYDKDGSGKSIMPDKSNKTDASFGRYSGC